MYSSEAFGRLFWVDDNYDLQSCPLNEDGTGDFNCTDYVCDWDDFTDVDIPLLLRIQQFCIINKRDYAGSLTHKEEKVTNKDEDKMIKYEWNEEFYNQIVLDYEYRFPKFDVNNYPIHLTQH